MSQPQERIQSDLKDAMKARDAERTSTLRMLLSEMRNERIRLGHELADEEFVTVLQRGVKQRQDSIEQYRRAGREDLATKEEREAQVLGSYLPEQLSEGEVRRAVVELVREQGLAGPRELGKVMQALLPRYKGRLDGKTLQRVAREVLGG